MFKTSKCYLQFIRQSLFEYSFYLSFSVNDDHNATLMSLLIEDEDSFSGHLKKDLLSLFRGLRRVRLPSTSIACHCNCPPERYNGWFDSSVLRILPIDSTRFTNGYDWALYLNVS